MSRDISPAVSANPGSCSSLFNVRVSDSTQAHPSRSYKSVSPLHRLQDSAVTDSNLSMYDPESDTCLSCPRIPPSFSKSPKFLSKSPKSFVDHFSPSHYHEPFPSPSHFHEPFPSPSHHGSGEKERGATPRRSRRCTRSPTRDASTSRSPSWSPRCRRPCLRRRRTSRPTGRGGGGGVRARCPTAARCCARRRTRRSQRSWRRTRRRIRRRVCAVG